ncbi:MAG TPA: MFS transporter [Jiangellaceae bacterium]
MKDTAGVSTDAAAGNGVILALACAAQFMVVLDIAIVNVALPSIRQDLDLEQGTLQWIVIAYGLMLGGFLLLGGRLADHLGRRRILIAGLVLFSTASLLAGLAESAELLIASRALQGFGAALIPPAALSILAVTFADGGARNKALGIYGATAGVSASVGVIASGLLTDGPGWRWVFLINLPVGALLIALAAVALPGDRRSQRGEAGFDVPGAVTVTGGLLLLVYAVNRGNDFGWGSSSTLGLFAASLVTLLAFVVIEARSHTPLVPLAVLNRTAVAANVSAFFVFGTFFSFIFLGSLLMQQVLDYSALQTGAAWLATSVTSFFAAAITGSALVANVGVRRLLVVGLSLLAVSAALLTRVRPDGSFATDLLPALALAGIAGGMSAPAAQIGALSGVTESLSGLASGLVETAREIGGAIGVAAVSTALLAGLGDRPTTVDGAGSVTVDAFDLGFWVMFGFAALGALTVVVTFPRSQPADRGLAQAPGREVGG